MLYSLYVHVVMHCDVNGVAYIVSWLGNDTNCTYKHQMDEVNTDDNTLTTSLTKCYEIDSNEYM